MTTLRVALASVALFACSSKKAEPNPQPDPFTTSSTPASGATGASGAGASTTTAPGTPLVTAANVLASPVCLGFTKDGGGAYVYTRGDDFGEVLRRVDSLGTAPMVSISLKASNNGEEDPAKALAAQLPPLDAFLAKTPLIRCTAGREVAANHFELTTDLGVVVAKLDAKDRLTVTLGEKKIATANIADELTWGEGAGGSLSAIHSAPGAKGVVLTFNTGMAGANIDDAKWIALDGGSTTASADKCGDGKISFVSTSARLGGETTLYCKADGTPAILSVELDANGDVLDRWVTNITVKDWNELWRLSESANWKALSEKTLCAMTQHEMEEPRTLTFARDGKVVSVECVGEMTPPFVELSSRMSTLARPG